MLNDLRDSFDKNSTEYQFYNNVLEGLNLSIDNQAPTSILDQNIQLKERLDDGEEIIEDETSFLEVPQINNSISTPDVVSPIPLPEIASAPMSDPSTMTRLENVGMPLFNANQGGIASLMSNKKVKQMVA